MSDLADQAKLRCLEIRGVRYLRAEDVAALLREAAATEEADVRTRFDDLARRLDQPASPSDEPDAPIQTL